MEAEGVTSSTGESGAGGQGQPLSAATPDPAAGEAATSLNAGAAEESEGVGGSTAPKAEEEELVVPQVDQSLQEELVAMGFSLARSVRALHATGSSGLEAAVNWIVEHEEDPDIDVMPMVPKDAAAPEPKLTPEEAKRRAEELVERARRKKEEEEKRMEREREQQRIRAGKELQEAKRIADDEERKRRIDERRREKEEEARARQRILQRLEEDKRERRRRLGLPEEEPAAKEPTQGTPPPTVSSGSVRPSIAPARPVLRAEKMREALRNLKQRHKDDGPKVTRAFETLLKYVSNLGSQPGNDKFQRIRIANPTFQERVGCFEESLEFLQLCGFEREEVEGEAFLAVPPGVQPDIAVLRAAGTELSAAISNPYFGVL